MKCTFTKKEKVCNEKIAEDLFTHGATFSVANFRIFWQMDTLITTIPAQILISIPKKRMKHATDRNHMKRLIKEAYRKNKHSFYQFLTEKNKQCVFALVFTGRENISYPQAEDTILLILQRLYSEYEKLAG
ncbi:MAG: ribonuclease P protein component [Lentimicrobiaceae bacterium]|nr:ribonuclease P protein component [Lentimicrobiaceae bacterium]